MATAPAFVPLALARRRYGRRALGLSILALALVALVLVAQSPPSLRRGSVALALILVVIYIGVGALSLLWTWMFVWPTQGRGLEGAKRLPVGAALTPGPGREPSAPFVVLVVGGLLVGLLLWGVLNTVGLIGAPMLWIVAGTINLEVARRVRRVERAAGVVYYETPVMFPFTGGQRLFVHPTTGAGGRWATVAEQRATRSGRTPATTGRPRRG